MAKDDGGFQNKLKKDDIINVHDLLYIWYEHLVMQCLVGFSLISCGCGCCYGFLHKGRGEERAPQDTFYRRYDQLCFTLHIILWRYAIYLKAIVLKKQKCGTSLQRYKCENH